MKKTVTTTVILALVVGLGGGLWLKIQLDGQKASEVAQEQTQPKPEPSKYDVGPPDPQEILELVNEERERIGVPPLEYDDNVAKSAQLKADDMAAKGYRGHEIPGLDGDLYTQEMRKLIYTDAKCESSGENLAWNRAGGATTSRAMFDALMNSKPHREAIQDTKHHRIGVGVSDSLVVQHFCKNSM